jgi:hypothetical protein
LGIKQRGKRQRRPLFGCLSSGCVYSRKVDKKIKRRNDSNDPCGWLPGRISASQGKKRTEQAIIAAATPMFASRMMRIIPGSSASSAAVAAAAALPPATEAAGAAPAPPPPVVMEGVVALEAPRTPGSSVPTMDDGGGPPDDSCSHVGVLGSAITLVMSGRMLRFKGTSGAHDSSWQHCLLLPLRAVECPKTFSAFGACAVANSDD